MKYLVCAFLFVLSLVIVSVALAQEFCKCKTVCRTDSGGHTICKTECRGQCR